MAITLPGTDQRIALNQASRIGLLEQVSGSMLEIPQGGATNIHFALFDGEPSLSTLITDISNIDEIQLVIRAVAPNGTVLYENTNTSAGDWNQDLFYEDWLDGSSEHFVFHLSSDDTNISLPDEGDLSVYFMVKITVGLNDYLAGFGYGKIVNRGLTDLTAAPESPFEAVFVNSDGDIQNEGPINYAAGQLEVDGVAIVSFVPGDYVPSTRTVNGLPLSSNIVLSTLNINDALNRRYVTDAQLVLLGNTSGTNTGDQTITLTGNVTGSGTGSFATTIAAGVVTLAMMANMNSASLIYRKSASSGPPEVTSLVTLKVDLGLTGVNSGDQVVPVNTTATGSQWFSAYNATTGSFTKTQPATTDLTGFGTGVTTALAVNVGSTGAFVVLNGALGTPSSGTLTNCTFPTLNQNTTGSAASLSVSGQTGLLTFTGITSTSRVKTVRDAVDTILELGGSYTPSGTWTSMTFVTPVLGTPTSGTLTNCTGLPVGGVSGLGTGVATALAVNIGSAGAFIVFNGALGTPSSGTVTNLTGTASININGTVGATTPAAGTFTTLVAGSATSLLVGTAGTSVGSVGFRNATSGTATLAPPTGALGTYQITLPNAASTLPIFGQQITFTGPTAARTITFIDAAHTVARQDAAQTFTGVQTFTSPVISGHCTIEGVVPTGATGTGKLVFDTGPTVDRITILHSTQSAFYLKRADGTSSFVIGRSYANDNSHNFFFYDLIASQNRMYIDASGNIGLSTCTAFGTSAAGVLGMVNAVEPSTSPADTLQLFAVDISAGNSSLGIRTETAVTASAAGASDAYLNIRVNGTTYKLLLHT